MKIKEEKRAKNKVFVGLSGGVDSAVSAGLLKKQGYDVTGVFIKAWTPELDVDGFTQPCTWKEDRRSAMRVCAVLDIPFITLDLEKEYKEDVVDYMVREYRAGRTPNPDVMCNKEIKFGAFLKWALNRGANFVATGHYANKLRAESLKLKVENTLSSKLQAPSWVLAEGKDKNKDQSYFLWALTPEQLKHVLFPVGGLEKKEVRKLAEKFGLPQATRKDSQGLCFLGQVDMKEFLRHYIEPKRGDVINEEGEVIGYHDGALFFTLGERHGFTVTHKSYSGKPLYVIDKDVEKNTIIVASSKLPARNASHIEAGGQVASNTNTFELKDVNLVQIPGGEITCRFRYRQEKLNCKIEKFNENWKLEIENLEERPASGQSVVFYQGEVCLGGAVIE